MPTINVIDAAGDTQTVNTLPASGNATAANALPTIGASEVLTSGTISILNSNLTGTATANSAVETIVGGYNTMVVQITGMSGGNLIIQGTVDGLNWVSIGSRIQNFNTATTLSLITTSGILITDVTGLYKVRVTSSLFSGSNINVLMSLSSGFGAPAVIVNVATMGTVSLITAANLNIPVLIPDLISTNATATVTSGPFTPTFGCSYEVNIAISVLTGTGPTLDFVIQESDDTGTNWFDIYHFERITAAGSYRSPKLPLTGNRVRYVQNLGGTSLSYTRAINRLQSSDTATPIRRFFDRTRNSTQAQGDVTGSYTMGNPSKNIQLIISAGAITTTAPAFKVQGSEDGGVSWYDIPGAALTAVASSSVQVTASNVRAPLLRAIVTTAGSGATLNYVCIKTYD